MSDFWIDFTAGIASGIVLVVLGAFVRRLIRKRSKGEPIKLNAKEFRPLVAIAIGFALIFIDIFLISDGGVLRGLGGMILIWSALEYLS